MQQKHNLWDVMAHAICIVMVVVQALVLVDVQEGVQADAVEIVQEHVTLGALAITMVIIRVPKLEKYSTLNNQSVYFVCGVICN